jgi:hypothetical protein
MKRKVISSLLKNKVIFSYKHVCVRRCYIIRWFLRRHNKKCHVNFESHELLSYQVRTLGRCCSHGRDMTGSKMPSGCVVALRRYGQGAWCLKAYWRLVKESACLTLVCYSTKRAKIWRTDGPHFPVHFVGNINGKKVGKYSVYSTIPLKHYVATHMEYYRSKICHFFHNFYYVHYNTITII